MGGGSSSSSSSSSAPSSSSSIDSISNNHPSLSSASSSVCLQPNTKTSCDLSTDLRLGPSIVSASHIDHCSSSAPGSRDQRFDWPQIKPLLLRNTRAGTANNLFVKVYMEGISIGRKLDLFAHGGYDELVTTLSHMFKTTIACSDPDVGHGGAAEHSGKYHILTYEDEDGDWMMVGDVPWEMFLNTVKRLKITRGDRG